MPQNAQAFKRTIKINGSISGPNEILNKNYSKISNYSFITFIPATLFFALKKPLLLWYLFIIILELSISYYNYYFTTYPFATILILNTIAQSINFYNDFKKDRFNNNKECLV